MNPGEIFLTFTIFIILPILLFFVVKLSYCFIFSYLGEDVGEDDLSQGDEVPVATLQA